MEGLVLLEDKLQQYRINTIMGAFINVIETSRQFWKDTLICIEELIILAIESVDVAKWIQDRSKKELQWLLKWLDDNARAPYGNDSQMSLMKRRKDSYYGR